MDNALIFSKIIAKGFVNKLLPHQKIRQCVSPWLKLNMAPNNFEVKDHTQIDAQSLAIT
jgi:hypothetical protein